MGRPTDIPPFRQGNDGSGKGFFGVCLFIVVIGIGIWLVGMVA